MSNKQTLPPKVAEYLRESKPILARVPELEKRAEAAAAAEAKVKSLTKSASDQQAALAKLAKDTADNLLSNGIIAKTDHAKYASDLSDPEKVHNVLRYLGKKYAALEAQAAAPSQGRPSSGGGSTKIAEGEKESANDTFNRRLHAATGA